MATARPTNGPASRGWRRLSGSIADRASRGTDHAHALAAGNARQAETAEQAIIRFAQQSGEAVADLVPRGNEGAMSTPARAGAHPGDQRPAQVLQSVGDLLRPRL